MSRPLVSVVIPAYNAEDTIGRAIDSVLAQTLGDWELIVVDDGSTDRTAEAARSRGDRVRVIRCPHLGPGPARNQGAEAALGQYLAWLDADDVWYPTKLEWQLGLASTYDDLEFISGNYRFIDESGRSLGTGFDRVPWLMERVRREARNGAIVFSREDVPNFLRRGFGSSITMMLTRGLFDRIGGFCGWLSVAEDMHLAMRAVAASSRFGAVCEPIATYYLRQASTVRTDHERSQRETVRAYRDLRRMLSQCGRPIRRALAESLSRAHLDHATVLAKLGRRREGIAEAWRSLRLNPRRMALTTMVGLALGDECAS
ncbi:MAG: glycosyltransferase family 2 protein [Phycisphaerae bacterium]|nr:glycosyltransferase family 2 protein [Phycisphaerae bacterium]